MEDMVVITSNNEVVNHTKYFPNLGIFSPYVPLQISKIWMSEEDYKDIVKFSKE